MEHTLVSSDPWISCIERSIELARVQQRYLRENRER